MKSNLDKHIDSKIKNSFESLQRKAPIHLWENIAQGMDLEQTLDDSIDEKVQESFAQVDKTAPAFLWNAISTDLDQNNALDASIDDKIKESFDRNINKTAPAFLWGAISEDLNQTGGNLDLDAVIDGKVKESFDQQKSAKTPNAVWFGISRQLNIDKTWNKISAVLDHKPVVSDWRKRMLQFFGAAAILLLFVKTCEFEPHANPIHYTTYDRPLIVEDQKTPQNNNEQNAKALISKENQENNNNNNEKLNVAPTLDGNQNKTTSNSNSNPNEQVVGNTINNKAQISGSTVDKANANPVEKLDNKKVTSVEANPSILVKKGSKDADTPQDGTPIMATANDHNTTDAKNPAIATTANAKTNSNDKQSTNVNAVENKVQEANPSINWAILDAIHVGQLPLALTTEPIQLLEDFKLENSKQKKNLVEGKLSAGAFIVVNSTMLINNDTREGFDQNSLVQNYFGLAANYGLWAAYKITQRGSIVAEFSINADNKSAYGVYDQGVFYIKEWVMKYNRISLAYKHNLWGTDSDKLVDTKIVGEVGMYLGFMREAKLFYDGELFYDALAEHHIIDVGFKVSLGQEILIDKFVIGYGIRSDIGVSNIFKGNAKVGAQENPTNLINLGGYFSLGYRF